MEPGSAASFFVTKVATIKRSENIEALARMAARLAGRDPDEQISLTLGQETAFEGPVWRYPDFIARAEAAYEVLVAPRLLRAEELNGHGASIWSGPEIRKPAWPSLIFQRRSTDGNDPPTDPLLAFLQSHLRAKKGLP